MKFGIKLHPFMQVAEPIVDIVDCSDNDCGRNEESSADFFSVAIARTFPSEHADAVIRIFLDLFVGFSTLLPSKSAFVAVFFLLTSLTECQHTALVPLLNDA